MDIELSQAREIAENYGQHSRGRRVKGSEMADRALAENPADTIHHVVRSQTCWLIDYYDAVDDNTSHKNL
jgi:hypothetical protein